MRLSFCNPGFMFPSHLICKPKSVGLCHLLDCWIILFCRKINIRKWELHKTVVSRPSSFCSVPDFEGRCVAEF